jgi:Spy/CpxP family protein refolding chaperone
MAGHEHRGGGDMMGGWGQRGSGPHWGGAWHGGGRAAMRELAALGVRLYPARMLLRKAQEIGLTPDQVTKIRQEMLAAQGRAVDLMAKVGHARIEIARLLSADKADERAVDAQIDEAAKAGAEMHKLHLGALLRIRALLTPEQRQKLDERKPRHEGPKAGTTPGHVPEPIGDRDDDEEDEEDDWGG